jgi:hypothetical protein
MIIVTIPTNQKALQSHGLNMILLKRYLCEQTSDFYESNQRYEIVQTI